MAEETHLYGFNSDTLFNKVCIFCNVLLMHVGEIENPVEEECFLWVWEVLLAGSQDTLLMYGLTQLFDI